MLYRILHFPASIAIYLYCRYIRINHKEFLNSKGPLLIASNHPNSFLDAIILASLFKRPIYSLARGDAFAGKFISSILKSLNMLPVYRISEGAENLAYNFTTFDACNDIFKRNGIVLIFSEGHCINEWHLRPLKKGTARLSFAAWNQNIPLQIIPLGINYSSFRSFGKNVHLNFGKLITKDEFDLSEIEGKKIISFNNILKDQLKNLVYEINVNDEKKRLNIFHNNVNLLKRYILFIPAVLGFVLHFPLYFPIILMISKKENDHYDSIIVGLLILLYPVYLFLLMLLLFLTLHNYLFLLVLIVFPFCAWSYLQIKKQ